MQMYSRDDPAAHIQNKPTSHIDYEYDVFTLRSARYIAGKVNHMARLWPCGIGADRWYNG